MRKAKTTFAMAGSVFLAMGFAAMGCCGDAEEKAEQMADKAKALETEISSLQSQIGAHAAVKKKVKDCKSKLKEARVKLGRQGRQEELIAMRFKTISRLLTKLKKSIESGELAVRVRRGRMVLEMPSAVLFQSGKADLSDKGKKTLDSVAEGLKEITGRKFQVAGHTDNVPVNPGNPYGTNWHLSSARAVEVVLYLKEKGVKPKNLSAAGYAHFQPVGSNQTQKGKAQNRRIEITLMPNLAELPDLSNLKKKLGLSKKGKKKAAGRQR